MNGISLIWFETKNKMAFPIFRSENSSLAEGALFYRKSNGNGNKKQTTDNRIFLNSKWQMANIVQNSDEKKVVWRMKICIFIEIASHRIASMLVIWRKWLICRLCNFMSRCLFLYSLHTWMQWESLLCHTSITGFEVKLSNDQLSVDRSMQVHPQHCTCTLYTVQCTHNETLSVFIWKTHNATWSNAYGLLCE